MKVAIIGLGVTGQSQVETFKDHEVVLYDPLDHDEYPARARRAARTGRKRGLSFPAEP